MESEKLHIVREYDHHRSERLLDENTKLRKVIGGLVRQINDLGEEAFVTDLELNDNPPNFSTVTNPELRGAFVFLHKKESK